jgi:hypothetical protein
LFKGEQAFKFVSTFAQFCHTFVTRTAAFGERGVADLSDFADMWVMAMRIFRLVPEEELEICHLLSPLGALWVRFVSTT